MLRWILLLLFALSTSNALEITINSAVEEHQPYAILHLRNTNSFACEALCNEFDVTTKIVCAFAKKPSKPIGNLEDNFFKIQSIIKQKTFFVIIHPIAKMKLIPVVFNLTHDASVYEPKVNLAKHWIVIGYKDKLPLIHQDEPNDIGINFPFYMKNSQMPFVGGLDIKGNPVYIKKVEDVTDYLKIKKDFKAKKYEQTLDLIETVLEDYPHTLFKAELIYYKIKVYAKLKDNENVIDNAKLFLREYSGDENVPEVLSLMARAYALVGQNTDADYFFDRLFSEQAESVYAKWGYIYKGEMLEDSGGVKAATKFYNKALNETKDINVAVSAAFHLSLLKSETSMKSAQQYVEKILKVKPAYFYEHFKESYDLMNSFADAEHYEVAAKMAEALYEHVPMGDDYQEELLKDSGVWYAKTQEKKHALKLLNKYLNTYSDGDYRDVVQSAKDALFFDVNDQNSSVKLQEYDKLIEEYKGDTIGDKALYEKAKVLLEEHKYFDLLAMRSQLKALDGEHYSDVNQLIDEAVKGAMNNSLKAKKCHKVLRLANDYNITLSDSWDDGLYNCAMKGGDFALSKSIADKNLHSKNLEARKKWLFRYIKVDFATGNYSDVVNASKDLIALIQEDKNSPYKEVYRYLFDTYNRLEKSDGMIKMIAIIEKQFPQSYKDLDRYTAMVGIGEAKKDDTLIIKYATKALAIEQKAKAYPQSPYLEFTLYGAYMNKGEFEKALDVIERLDSFDLAQKQRARQKYLLGNVYSKLWRDDEATQAYKAAIKADPTSAWADLAKSAMKL